MSIEAGYQPDPVPPPGVIYHLVILGCGHWFQESWPPRIEVDPGLRRVCSYPNHRGRFYHALTLPIPEQGLPESGGFDLASAVEEAFGGGEDSSG